MKRTNYSYCFSIVAITISVLAANTVVAQTLIDTGLFSKTSMIPCVPNTLCTERIIEEAELDYDYDLSVTGEVSTFIANVERAAYSATQAGYDGSSRTPAISSFGTSNGEQILTVDLWGFQKYTFVTAGEITLTGTLTYSQSGSSGRIELADFQSFQFDDNEFDASDCSLFSGANFDNPNSGNLLYACARGNGQTLPPPDNRLIEFTGIDNFQRAVFNVPSSAVTGGQAFATLSVTGQAGDVVFVGVRLFASAIFDASFDTRNTLKIEVDKPELVEPSFSDQTFEPAPANVTMIDIKPGDDENCLNVNGHGAIPVGILGTETLDMSAIDLWSLNLGGVGVRVRGNNLPQCHLENINSDDYMDLVCQFEDYNPDWSLGDGVLTLRGNLLDGSNFAGSDTICIVPRKSQKSRISRK